MMSMHWRLRRDEGGSTKCPSMEMVGMVGSSDGARSSVARSMKAPDVMEATNLNGMGLNPRTDHYG